MGATTRAVLHGLSIIAEERNGLGFGFDYETLEKWSGASRRTIRRHLKRAEARGWLSRDKTWVELTHREKSDFHQNRSDCPDRVTGQNDRPDRMTGQADRSDNLTGQSDRSDRVTGQNDRSSTDGSPASSSSPKENKSFSHSSKENSSPSISSTPGAAADNTQQPPSGNTTTDDAETGNNAQGRESGGGREPAPREPSQPSLDELQGKSDAAGPDSETNANYDDIANWLSQKLADSGVIDSPFAAGSIVSDVVGSLDEGPLEPEHWRGYIQDHLRGLQARHDEGELDCTLKTAVRKWLGTTSSVKHWNTSGSDGGTKIGHHLGKDLGDQEQLAEDWESQTIEVEAT
jgi:hypothetical protein